MTYCDRSLSERIRTVKQQSRWSNMEGQKPERKYVRQKQLEQMYPMSAAFWERHRWAGSGPPFQRLGRAVVYDLAEVEAWMAVGRVEGAPVNR